MNELLVLITIHLVTANKSSLHHSNMNMCANHIAKNYQNHNGEEKL